MKTAKERFYEKLKELDLLELWEMQDENGAVGVETVDGIIILYHDRNQTERNGKEAHYFIYRYYPFELLRIDDTFRCHMLTRAINEWNNIEEIEKLITWFFVKDEKYNPIEMDDVFEEAEPESVIDLSEEAEKEEIVSEKVIEEDKEAIIEKLEGYERILIDVADIIKGLKENFAKKNDMAR